MVHNNDFYFNLNTSFNHITGDVNRFFSMLIPFNIPTQQYKDKNSETTITIIHYISFKLQKPTHCQQSNCSSFILIIPNHSSPINCSIQGVLNKVS